MLVILMPVATICFLALLLVALLRLPCSRAHARRWIFRQKLLGDLTDHVANVEMLTPIENSFQERISHAIQSDQGVKRAILVAHRRARGRVYSSAAQDSSSIEFGRFQMGINVIEK